MKTSLDGINRVRFNDFTEYDIDKCNNGGAYGYWTDFSRQKDGLWERTYGTTSDIEFCPCCGVFADHTPVEEEECKTEFTCGNCEKFTEKEVLEMIADYTETEDEYIEYK